MGSVTRMLVTLAVLVRVVLLVMTAAPAALMQGVGWDASG